MRQALLFLILVQGYIIWGKEPREVLSELSLMEMAGLIKLEPLEATLTEKGHAEIMQARLLSGTIQWVVDVILYNAEDDAFAHQLEMALYHRLLEAISEGRVPATGVCAQVALKSKAIEFERYYG